VIDFAKLTAAFGLSIGFSKSSLDKVMRLLWMLRMRSLGPVDKLDSQIS
jgi:hypothetical protein